MRTKEFIKLDDAISELLSERNRDKSLGEISERLNDYIVEIKHLVDTRNLTYEQLREEILKHMNSIDDARPGSLAQILVGCIKGEESCPMKKEDIENVSFIYQDEDLIPLTKTFLPFTDESYAIIYINGDPGEIDIESLRELEGNGFKKMKIKHRESLNLKYETLEIENLKRYIYSRPEKASFGKIIAILSILAIIVFITLTKVSSVSKTKL